MPPLRESTRIPKDAARERDRQALRYQAQQAYIARMSELARDAVAVIYANGSQPAKIKPQALRRSPSGWCYVYIVRQGALVKIGKAVDVDQRLKALQAGNGRSFEVLATFPAHSIIEAAIHSRFKHLREKGEWFRVDEDMTAFIAGVQQGANPIALLWSAA